MELIEEKLADLEESVKETVTKTAEKAVEAMRHSLTEVVMEGQGMATKKLGAEFEAMAGRLKGRINRNREYHESLINTMRNEQIKFQSEFKSTITGLQSFRVPLPEGVERSVNIPGSASEVRVLECLGMRRWEKGLGENIQWRGILVLVDRVVALEAEVQTGSTGNWTCPYSMGLTQTDGY